MDRELEWWLTLPLPRKLQLYVFRADDSVIIRWLTSTKGISETEEELFAILNSSIIPLNFNSFENLNLLRTIAICLQNLGMSDLIGRFFFDVKNTISMIFTQEQLVKLFTEFKNNKELMLFSETYEDELFYAVAEYINWMRQEFIQKALLIIDCGFVEHIAMFFDDWNKGINAVCTSEEIICWILDEPLPENLKTFLGAQSSEMHKVAVSLCDNNLRSYIVKFWNHDYNDLRNLQLLDDDGINDLIKKITPSKQDKKLLRKYLKTLNPVL